jgi:hypothetical protein
MFLTFYPSADAGISDPRSLATFRRKIPFFGGGRNERQKAKPAKLGVAGLRVDLG